eukprot:6013905-Ditylum_brightwellii.AAC.1
MHVAGDHKPASGWQHQQWIMPEEGLNKKEKYEGKLIGDYPEMNALNANLNKDIYDRVHHHISNA